MKTKLRRVAILALVLVLLTSNTIGALASTTDTAPSLSNSNGNEKIENEIRKMERKKDMLTEAYLEEILPKDDYKKKYSALERKIEELEKNIVPIEENDDILEIEETIRNIDQEVEALLADYADDPQVRTNFLIEHIKKITVFPNKELAIEFDLFAGALLVADGGMLLQVEDGDSDFMLYDRESVSVYHGRICNETLTERKRSF